VAALCSGIDDTNCHAVRTKQIAGQ
jgi:hypothetical protein